MVTRLTRRQFLRVGSLGVIGLAGCFSVRRDETMDSKNSTVENNEAKTTNNTTDQEPRDGKNESMIFVDRNESQIFIDKDINLSELSSSSGCELKSRVETMC